MFVGRVTGSMMSLLPSRWIITRSPGNSNSTGIRTAWLRLLRNSLASLGLDGVNRGACMAWFSNVYGILYMPDRDGRTMRLLLWCTDTGVVSPVRCRRLRAANGAQSKAHSSANTQVYCKAMQSGNV